MTETPPQTVVDGWGRMKGVSLVKPVVYGSMATYFSKKREEDGHTHSWSVYVRPYYHEDTTKWIRKVTFKLHESYANPTRVCEKPPYLVKETGWGEFEIIIKIYFVDPNEKAVTCFHILKLFQQDPNCIAGRKPVLSEYYDEIVFQEPSQFLYKQLMASEKAQKQLLKGNDPESKEKKKRTLEKIMAAREDVRKEIDDFRESLKEAKTLLQSWRDLNSKVENVSSGVGLLTPLAPLPSPAAALPSPAPRPAPSPSTPLNVPL